jgi:hypothetical protein
MADDSDVGGMGAGGKDGRCDWIRDRVCSSLKVKGEAVEKLFQGDGK